MAHIILGAIEHNQFNGSGLPSHRINQLGQYIPQKVTALEFDLGLQCRSTLVPSRGCLTRLKARPFCYGLVLLAANGRQTTDALIIITHIVFVSLL